MCCVYVYEYNAITTSTAPPSVRAKSYTELYSLSQENMTGVCVCVCVYVCVCV